MTPMSAWQGICKNGSPAPKALCEDFQQLTEKHVFSVLHASSLTAQEKLDDLQIINLIKEKQNGTLKGRTCADSWPQQKWYEKHEKPMLCGLFDAISHSGCIWRPWCCMHQRGWSIPQCFYWGGWGYGPDMWCLPQTCCLCNHKRQHQGPIPAPGQSSVQVCTKCSALVQTLYNNLNWSGFWTKPLWPLCGKCHDWWPSIYNYMVH